MPEETGGDANQEEKEASLAVRMSEHYYFEAKEKLAGRKQPKSGE